MSWRKKENIKWVIHVTVLGSPSGPKVRTKTVNNEDLELVRVVISTLNVWTKQTGGVTTLVHPHSGNLGHFVSSPKRRYAEPRLEKRRVVSAWPFVPVKSDSWSSARRGPLYASRRKPLEPSGPLVDNDHGNTYSPLLRRSHSNSPVELMKRHSRPNKTKTESNTVGT